MKNIGKYQPNYFSPPIKTMKWTQKDYIDHAPTWCSVDLRDGNQSLIVPMSLDEKVEFFKMLVKVGFKEIEIGFPAASETEYEFLRKLIDDKLIPKDVTIQVLTQARDHIIRKTFEALDGVDKAIVHLYNSISVAQREQVFCKSKQEILEIAVEGAKLLDDLSRETKGNFRFEYSPESFTATEVDYSLEVVNAVLDVWKPTSERKVIVNLPATVEMSMPHVYANQIEYMNDNMKYRENVILSLHPHNDRGTGVADSELGILAGADRIEGTLFGNGERTGNVDIIILALNMYSQGVDPGLDFHDMPEICRVYENTTRMKVYDRQPYSGDLVFAAFSGSHQDAIAKGMKFREDKGRELWSVPYLPIDPKDVGREYETNVIRINSQSGKGGIGYTLEHNYGFVLPAKMREDFGYIVKNVSDHKHKELVANEIYNIFKESYFDKDSPIELVDFYFTKTKQIEVELTIKQNGKQIVLKGAGNGRLSAVSNALNSIKEFTHSIVAYNQHALQSGSHAEAVAYVCIDNCDKKSIWAAAIDEDIVAASIHGLINAVNRIN